MSGFEPKTSRIQPVISTAEPRQLAKIPSFLARASESALGFYRFCLRRTGSTRVSWAAAAGVRVPARARPGRRGGSTRTSPWHCGGSGATVSVGPAGGPSSEPGVRKSEARQLESHRHSTVPHRRLPVHWMSADRANGGSRIHWLALSGQRQPAGGPPPAAARDPARLTGPAQIRARARARVVKVLVAA